jgi:hypothetical protein
MVLRIVEKGSFTTRKEVRVVSKLILSSNLPKGKKPTPVVGAKMQKYCNCSQPAKAQK